MRMHPVLTVPPCNGRGHSDFKTAGSWEMALSFSVCVTDLRFLAYSNNNSKLSCLPLVCKLYFTHFSDATYFYTLIWFHKALLLGERPRRMRLHAALLHTCVRDISRLWWWCLSNVRISFAVHSL